ncbi:MAG: hypothetical protein B6I30_09370, partial [Desulfobacteraceae bacterium 4572_187]
GPEWMGQWCSIHNLFPEFWRVMTENGHFSKVSIYNFMYSNWACPLMPCNGRRGEDPQFL